MYYIVKNNKIINNFKAVDESTANFLVKKFDAQKIAVPRSYKQPVIVATPEGITITEGWMPPAAERIAFLNRLKTQLLDRTTALKLPPETVMQLAIEMYKFSLLADIGADETLYATLHELPPNNPIINGETKEWLLAELRAYIRSYKPDFEIP